MVTTKAVKCLGIYTAAQIVHSYYLEKKGPIY
jgi:hypothetical protein